MVKKLNPKQLKAARLMVYGQSAVEINRQLRLSANTLTRWKEKPEFIAEYNRVMNEQQGELRYRMTNLAAASLNVLWSELHGDPIFSQRVKVALNLVKIFGPNLATVQVVEQNLPETCEALLPPADILTIRRP